MFGRNKKDEQLDHSRVQQTVSSTSVPGVRNLTVRQNGTVFEIHGEADTLAQKQQAFQNITGQLGVASGLRNLIQTASETQSAPTTGGPLDTPAAGPQSSGASTAAGRTHTVAKGETLSHIAQRYYGKASMYNRIFEANRDQLNDPDKIREGMTLKIPT
jgi:nucleoid-associated protein YgaU